MKKSMVKKVMAAMIALNSFGVSVYGNESDYIKLMSNKQLQAMDYELQGIDKCMPTNLYYIAKHYGYDVDLQEMADYEDHIYYTSAINYYSEKYDLNVEKIQNINRCLPYAERLKEKLDEGKIISLRVRASAWYNDDSLSIEEGHFISIVGYDEDQFLILDTNKLELDYCSYKELDKACDTPFLIALARANEDQVRIIIQGINKN